MKNHQPLRFRYFQLCISALLFASAYAGSGKKDAESKAVPLEKKLDKRGLLSLGYGYGINGLDVGYLGGGGHLGGVHGLNLGHSSLSLGHGYNGYNGYHGYNGLSSGYGSHGYLLGGHTDVLKTVTLLKGVPVPYPVEKHIPYAVEKHIPYAVKVPVPHPVEVIKHVPYSVKEYVKVPVHVPQNKGENNLCDPVLKRNEFAAVLLNLLC